MYFRYEGRTALYWAVVADDLEIMQVLISDYLWLLESRKQDLLNINTESPSSSSTATQTSLISNDNTGTAVARKHGCFAFLRAGSRRSEYQKLLAKVERALNTTLFEAACLASVQCAELLLKVGADVNAFYYHDDDVLSWCSPLISACAAPVTNSLMASRESSEQVIDATNTRAVAKVNLLLVKYIENVDLQMSEILVQYGADISRKNCFGQTALHWASRAGLTNTVPFLLRNGADIDATDKMGQTPLMGACDRAGVGCVDVCRVLLHWGADASRRGDKDDYTAFHFAVGNNHIPLVELFLDADICATTGSRCERARDVSNCRHRHASSWQQLSPLDIAVNGDQLDMVKCLLRAYADVNAPSCYNQTVTTGGGLIYLATDSIAVLQLLIDCGFDRASCRLVSRNRQMRAPVRDLLLQRASTIPPLAHLCRLVVRNSLRCRYKRAHELPLPAQLINFVNMKDMLS